MNENRNETTKWLQYLLYVGIAALVNSLLGIVGLSGLSRWIGIAVSGATAYLLYMLSGSNPRYKTAAICYAVALGGNFISSVIVGLVGSVCGIVAQYQEYHAHGELIGDRDPKLADQWGTLFGLQFAASIVVVLLAAILAATLAAATNISEAAITLITTVIVAVIGVALRVLYLRYLKRTIALVETEAAE